MSHIRCAGSKRPLRRGFIASRKGECSPIGGACEALRLWQKKKTNHIEILPVPLEDIAAMRGEKDFVELLRRELEWPIPMNP